MIWSGARFLRDSWASRETNDRRELSTDCNGSVQRSCSDFTQRKLRRRVRQLVLWRCYIYSLRQTTAGHSRTITKRTKNNRHDEWHLYTRTAVYETNNRSVFSIDPCTTQLCQFYFSTNCNYCHVSVCPMHVSEDRRITCQHSAK